MQDLDYSTSALPGRVVRLHFCCRAELPIGSTLRVTGSTLWAPTHLTAQDSSNAHHVADQNAAQGPAVGSLEVVDPHVLESSDSKKLYASSIELVTTPEDYPIWKTRRPVVVVMHKTTSSQIQHHCYRYMVVTPGAQVQSLEEYREKEIDTILSGNATTSDSIEGSIPVMMWEDPFPHLGNAQQNQSISTSSLPSVTSMKEKSTNKALTNLPYRTLDIEVSTAQVTDNPTSTNIPQGFSVFDNWNNGDDFSYRSYLIRESVRVALDVRSCYLSIHLLLS